MLIFAHRGLKLEYPENTREAFRAAVASNFCIELDIRLTKDRDLVCIHDRNPARVAGISPITNVRGHTVKELQALNAGAAFWQWRASARIPRFSDIAQHIIKRLGPNQYAAIHVKAEEQGEVQLAILTSYFHKYNLYEKAFLFDLTWEAAAKIRAMDPRIKIFISIGEKRYSPSIYLWQDFKGHERQYDGVWWDEWKIAGSEYTRKRASEIKKTGKLLYAVSPELHRDHGHPHAVIGYYQEWKRFIEWGADGVCTAFPRAFLEFLTRQ